MITSVIFAAFLLQARLQSVLDLADSLFYTGKDHARCESVLGDALSLAAPGKEKAEVLWRLSRTCFMMGENLTSKESKRSVYGKGMACAERAMKEDPSSPEPYMWHSANLGRDIQTRSLMEQASKLSSLTADLDMILINLGRTDFSAAWQAYSEIYHGHPFKSEDAAINFARKAAMCIPSGELRLSTYMYFADLLYKRNWSADKRRSEIVDNASKFKDKRKGLVERYESFDGSLGPGFKSAWSGSSSLGDISDREEAVMLVDYASALYHNTANPTQLDKADYEKLLSLRTCYVI